MEQFKQLRAMEALREVALMVYSSGIASVLKKAFGMDVRRKMKLLQTSAVSLWKNLHLLQVRCHKVAKQLRSLLKID